MRIVIDLQGAQSPGSRTRGIGRYTNALALAIARNAQQHEVVLALNGLFDDAIDEIKRRFDGLVAPHNFRVWQPPPFEDLDSAPAQRANERLYEAFLASLQPDVVCILSLFEGPGDGAVISIGSFAPLLTAVVLYDLIPLINAELYLKDPAARAGYMQKISAMRRADMWLAISESSRQEGIRYLGLDPERCINVSTAADEKFRVVDVSPEREQALRARHGLNKPFVMYTGGVDHRKNIEGLIEAFALLPEALRNGFQLAIVCSVRPADKGRLLALARQLGLRDDDLVVTDFVPDEELIDLYNLCHLFVFPSWHEGFGLPALEAMHCGAVVIGAETSSVPEVIGRADALFDPHDAQAMAAKIEQGLIDENFRRALREDGARRALSFNWDECGRRAVDGLERLSAAVPRHPPTSGYRGMRARLAYVSPLPPERSGIAAYSTELLPHLARYYDIDLITDLKVVDDLQAQAFPRRSIKWFRENANTFDRVLYHFGNSEFHQHMFDLLEEIPGTVVLHDFFLSGILAHREQAGGHAGAWTQALYASHGYHAVAERLLGLNAAEVLHKYPANFDVLTQAQGVIVHSPHSLELARQWFDPRASQDWAVVPLLREPKFVDGDERRQRRVELGFGPDDFVVCAFGLLGETKLNLQLIEAWLASQLPSSGHCHLIFVGQSDGSDYSARVLQRAQDSAGANIKITGWVDTQTFHHHLLAADLAVQLRTMSRGETSATVLGAMSYGLPTIVNANGSMAHLPQDAVWLMADDFEQAQLIEALERLWHAPQARHALAVAAQEFVATHHAPADCASAYAVAIERFAARAAHGATGLIEAIGADHRSTQPPPDGHYFAAISQAIVDSIPSAPAQRQIFIDVSELAQRDARTGIQRVVKGLLRELLAAPPASYRIEPVRAIRGQYGYHYARRFTLGFMGCPDSVLEDAPIDPREGDIFVGLDLEPRIVLEQRDFYRKLRHMGVRVEFVVYDLLPVLLRNRFMENASALHEQWLDVVAQGDGALCISRSVAAELRSWLSSRANTGETHRLAVRAFGLGVDPFPDTAKARAAAGEAKVLNAMAARPSFLMVGTIEPRKGHELVLDAFDRLWSRGVELNLVVVGRKGWMVDALAARLHRHPRQGSNLFWIDSADDDTLSRLYAAADCLLAASEGEGFGLPLIEAAQHGLPVLARDIPVFREVGGEHAQYFRGDPAALEAALVEWLEKRRQRQAPIPDAMACLTWQQSAVDFLSALMEPGQTPAATRETIGYEPAP